MQITVTGHQIDVGRALHDHVQERLGGGVDKYFDDAIEGHVAFSREGPRFRTHIKVHVGTGMTWAWGPPRISLDGPSAPAVRSP